MGRKALGRVGRRRPHTTGSDGVLQDSRRTLRWPQPCGHCRQEIAAGDWGRYEVFVASGQFLAYYSCYTCNEGRR